MRVWARLAGPYAYGLMLTGGAVLSWLEPPTTAWRVLCCSSWVCAAGWFCAYRIEREHRRRIARLAALNAMERGRPFGSIDGRVTRLLTPWEFADAYWMN